MRSSEARGGGGWRPNDFPCQATPGRARPARATPNHPRIQLPTPDPRRTQNTYFAREITCKTHYWNPPGLILHMHVQNVCLEPPGAHIATCKTPMWTHRGPFCTLNLSAKHMVGSPGTHFAREITWKTYVWSPTVRISNVNLCATRIIGTPSGRICWSAPRGAFCTWPCVQSVFWSIPGRILRVPT